MPDHSSIGSRMKTYEDVSRFHLTRHVPVAVRVDGRAFHTFCREFQPFDQRIIDGMTQSTLAVAKEMQGFKIAYIQSDEANLVMTDYDSLETQGWFNYNVNKIVSISAATMAAHFGANVSHPNGLIPIFDARAFNIPERDVANLLLWRAQDWKRNSISMHARRFFSHKELNQKNQKMMLEMLVEKGQDWNNLPAQHRYGTFIINHPDGCKVLIPEEDASYLSISKLVNSVFPK